MDINLSLRFRDIVKTSILNYVFQNLATGASFDLILETIPPLMDSLQIVWMLSCYYNTNERMVPLMERIAWQLCERVAQAIDVNRIFKYVGFEWQDLDFCCVISYVCVPG